MDFSFNEEQEAVRDLTAQILGERVTHERLKEFEAGTELVDRATWAALADANLLGVALPADVGGSGLGFLEACLIVEQVGRTAAPLPVLETVVMGAMPIAEFGSAEQRARHLPGVVSGERILTAALVEFGTPPEEPTTTATRRGDGWRLDGVKICVPAGLSAAGILVPARTGPDTLGVFLVAADAVGVGREPQDTTTGRPEARLELQGAPGEPLGAPDAGAAILDWILARTTTALCVLAIGVCEEALRMTAEYTKTREQFDRPIATFQAVGQRAADAYIDTEAIRLTAWQAAWRLSEGLTAAHEVAIAKYWASEGGQRVVHAASHLHGGIGVDKDYPLHRYFLLAKQIELTLGGTTPQLLKLGAMLAAEPA
jgi:alkylation response protein AidB-like acyl-CoA dehydrogenase